MSYKLIGKQNLLDKNTFHQILTADGTLIKGYDKNKIKLSDDNILSAYKWMMLQTRFDEKLTQMQRQGRMLTFVPNLGEVALQVATALAMDKDEDYLVPAFRSGLIMLCLGVTLKQQILYWNGNERGSQFGPNVKVLPINIPIATQYSHAAGIGYALKQLKRPGVAVTFIGDGGTSEGEFYEALNLASIHKWPTVFCINNNQWAISTPSKFQTNAVTLASKALGFGMNAIRVDGNDLFASHEAMEEALEHARSGQGPVLVEFLTYRQGPHSTADNPRIYRSEEYEKEQMKKEPLFRTRKFMESKNLWDAKKEQELIDYCDAQVMQAYNEAQAELKEELDEVFDYTYATLPEELKAQKEEARILLAKNLIKSE